MSHTRLKPLNQGVNPDVGRLPDFTDEFKDADFPDSAADKGTAIGLPPLWQQARDAKAADALQEPDGSWEIKKILAKKDVKGHPHYVVEWAGDPTPTLEPAENLDQCEDLLKDFQERREPKLPKRLKASWKPRPIAPPRRAIGASEDPPLSPDRKDGEDASSPRGEVLARHPYSLRKHPKP